MAVEVGRYCGWRRSEGLTSLAPLRRIAGPLLVEVPCPCFVSSLVVRLGLPVTLMLQEYRSRPFTAGQEVQWTYHYPRRNLQACAGVNVCQARQSPPASIARAPPEIKPLGVGHYVAAACDARIHPRYAPPANELLAAGIENRGKRVLQRLGQPHLQGTARQVGRYQYPEVGIHRGNASHFV